MPIKRQNETNEEFYARAGMSGRVGFGVKPAVLVIDEQKAMTDPACGLGSSLDEMVENSVAVISAANRRGIPVIYTVAAYKPDGSDAGVFAMKVPALKEATIGSKWAELDDRIPYRADRDYLFVKKQQSGFFGTPVLSVLKYHAADTVVVMGCSTSGCVRATVKDGVDYGYRMIIPRECVGDRLKEAHDMNLFEMNGKLGDVISAQEVLDYFESIV